VGTWTLYTTIEPAADGAVLTVKGRIGQVTAERFAEALNAAKRNNSSLVVDLNGVDYISGLGLKALQEAAEMPGGLTLRGVGEAVRNALELAALTPRITLID
jgi:anti-anti-sigma factor